MASHTVRPIVDIHAGRQVLDQHLPRVLSYLNQSMEELGWSRPTARTLLVPMQAEREGIREEYLLRLDFKAGPEWPPSARFVDPLTLDYRVHLDQHHIPQLTTPEVHTHTAYQSGDGQILQLICCSAVFEYYDVSHGGDDAILWRDTDTFFTTVRAIQRAFNTSYQGRFPVHGG